MTYLVFETEQLADTAEAQINSNMGCNIIGKNAHTGLPAPDKQKTIRWARPIKRLDDKWVFEKPVGNMDGVANFTEGEYSDDWFPKSDLI